MSSKPTELDANQLQDASMRVHYRAAAYHLASHQQLTPDEAMQMALRADQLADQGVLTEGEAKQLARRAVGLGCTGDCEFDQPCTCSHAIRWMAPRQPRRPAPRTPHLPLWTRLNLWAQSRMAFAGDWRDVAAVAGILVVMGAAIAAVGALVLLR